MDLFGDLPEPAASAPSKPLATTKEEKKTSRKRCFSNDECANEGSIAKRPLRDPYLLKGFSAERKGEREEMQDAHIIVEDFNPLLPHRTDRRISIFAVFDGHGGANASKRGKL